MSYTTQNVEKLRTHYSRHYTSLLKQAQEKQIQAPINQHQISNQYQHENPYIDSNMLKTPQSSSTKQSRCEITKPRYRPFNFKSNRKDTDYKWNTPYNNSTARERSREQLFLQQSLNIKIDPQHKKYLTKREIHRKYPREKYRRRKRENKDHILHSPCRKLLLSAMEFLTNQTRNTTAGGDGYKLVLYVTTTSTKHIPLLIELYPDIIIHLWCPNDCCPVLKRLNRVQLHQQHFTDKVAAEYAALGRDVLFICDICTRSVLKDNESKARWTKYLSSSAHLVAAMLNFRCPYPSVLYMSDSYEYLDGVIKIIIWAPSTSTETQLHIKPDAKGRIEQKIYSCLAYEEQLFWFNVKGRQSFIDNSKYHSSEYGVINSYDCWAECLILEQYLTYYKGLKHVTKTDVFGLIHKITKCFQHKKNYTKHQGILQMEPEQNRTIHKSIVMEFHEHGLRLSTMNRLASVQNIDPTLAACKKGWSVLPCYNLPIYNLIYTKSNIYLMPLRGFGDISFKVNPVYFEFYHKCFASNSCCCLTGFLMDNHGEKEVRYELNIIDILVPDPSQQYKKRKEQIKCIVDNYEKYKHTVTEQDNFRFIPLKLIQCPSEFDGEANIARFREKITKHPPGQDTDATLLKSDPRTIQWADIYFDKMKYKQPPNGWYFNDISLGTRIGGLVWIKNNGRNILFSDAYVGIELIDIDVIL